MCGASGKKSIGTTALASYFVYIPVLYFAA
jgi:hypothetical protein